MNKRSSSMETELYVKVPFRGAKNLTSYFWCRRKSRVLCRGIRQDTVEDREKGWGSCWKDCL